MAEQMFPIWDKTGTYIVTDPSTGTDMVMTESQVRSNIGKRELSVMNLRGVRKVVLSEGSGIAIPVGQRRIDSAQPFCVKITVGDIHHTYMHVGERCASYYDGRSLCIGSDGNGNKVFANKKINEHCL